jgi:hypothetical protein
MRSGLATSLTTGSESARTGVAADKSVGHRWAFNCLYESVEYKPAEYGIELK